MKSRRAILSTVSMAATVGLAGLAGCPRQALDTGATPSPEAGTPTGGPGEGSPAGESGGEADGTGAHDADTADDGTRDDIQGQTATVEGETRAPLAPIRSAFGALYADLRQVVEEEDVTLSAVEPRRQWESIGTQLDDAEQHLSGDQREQNRTLRKLHSITKKLVFVVEKSEQGSDALAALVEAVDAEQYGDAGDRLDTVREQFGDAESHLDAFRERFGGIEQTVDGFDEMDTEDVWTVADSFESLTEAMLEVWKGVDQFLKGSEQFQTARDDYDAERWGAASEGFRRAAGLSNHAVELMQTERPAILQDVDESIDRLVCFATATRDAARHYASAADAAQAGNWDTADAEVANAEEDRKRCE